MLLSQSGSDPEDGFLLKFPAGIQHVVDRPVVDQRDGQCRGKIPASTRDSKTCEISAKPLVKVLAVADGAAFRKNEGRRPLRQFAIK